MFLISLTVGLCFEFDLLNISEQSTSGSPLLTVDNLEILLFLKLTAPCPQSA